MAEPLLPAGPYTAQAIEGAQWDAMIAEFDDVTLDQRALFCAHRWGEGRVACVVVRDGSGDIVGGAACLRFTLPVVGGILYLRFGPVWRRHGASASIPLYTAVVTAIREYAARQGLATIIVPRPHPDFSAREAEALLALGFKHHLDITDDRYMVDCALSAEEQMASLAQTWRANLRRAQKAGVEVVELEPARYGEFEALYSRMMARKRVKLYDPVEVTPKLQHLGDQRPRTLIARHDGEAVAGIVYAAAGDIAYYLYGATNDNALPVRAGYALQWAVLERLRGVVRWYDLGGAPPTGKSLHQFKAGLVGKTGYTVEIPGEFSYAPNALGWLAMHTVIGIRQTRRHTRDWLQSVRRHLP